VTNLLRFCESRRDWLVGLVETLVRHESPSTDKAAVDRCADALAHHLRELGGRVEMIDRDQVGNLVRAEFGQGATRVLLLGHLDTVWSVGTLADRPLRHEAGRLYGPGVFDMKAGVAIGLLATQALVAIAPASDVRVVMLWTSDEEIGSRHSRAVIEDEARRSRAVLVLEPSLPDGAVKTARKGCGDFEIEVAGIAAHAGIDPERGASAVHELAHQIVELERLQDLEKGVSVNVGVIEGGTRPNVVAERAVARVDVRAPSARESTRLEQALRGLRPGRRGITLQVRGGFDRPPLERRPGVVRLYEQAREVARALGRDLGEGATGGGSDGNFTAALGVPTLDGLGAVGAGAHAADEHVIVADLPWRAALVAGLIARTAAG
jgi:glutamate carboxypeptidase